MENNHRTALKSFGKGQGKDTHFQTQMQRVFTALYRQPKTMLMVSIETGICPISKHRAGFYTTNPDLFPAIVEPSNTVKL